MALPKIGWNEGTLLRRTLLHVATFVIGSVAFVGLLSFTLVSVARGFSPHATDAAVEAPVADGKAPPGLKPAIRKKPAPAPAAEAPKDD